MNTKILMASSSLVLALAGVFALFAPEVALSLSGTTATAELSVLAQLMGALYLGFAMMNWAAKDSSIGGIYARPVSLGNFSHFFIGALLLGKYQLSHPFHLSMMAALFVYALFATLFYWLVFRATGIERDENMA